MKTFGKHMTALILGLSILALGACQTNRQAASEETGQQSALNSSESSTNGASQEEAAKSTEARQSAGTAARTEASPSRWAKTQRQPAEEADRQLASGRALGQQQLSTMVEDFVKLQDGLQLTKIELEQERGYYVYKLTGIAGDQLLRKEYGANSGKELFSYSKSLYQPHVSPLELSGLVDADQALAAAVEALPERQAELKSWTLEQEHGQVEYSFELLVNDGDERDDVEVRVSAQNAQVLEIDD